jgi:hypothetical protein
MRRLAPLIAASLLAAPAAEAKPRHHLGARLPVVVELFTAQGCSDCPAANDAVAKLADEKGVIALSFSVDYWDYLGWRDTFAKPEFAERQRAYKTAFRLRDVYTPQIVLDGTRELAGAKPEEIEAALLQARKDRPMQPDILLRHDGRLAVGGGLAPHSGAVIWLVRYAPGIKDVTIKAGENKGKILQQADEVRELIKLGPWRGKSRLLKLPEASEPDLKSVVLIQDAKDGRILAAKRL